MPVSHVAEHREDIMQVRSASGIAIISVLFILVAVLVLGAGAMYLTRVNLSIAANVRSNAVAQSNAEAGVEVGMIRLEELFRQAHATDPLTAALPATFSLPSATGPGYSPAYTLVSYARDTTNLGAASFSVRGTGPGNAEHVSDALVIMVPGQPEFPPGYSFGLASEGVIYVNGSSSYINAGIHGNLGFSLTGNVGDDFFVCTERDLLGRCIETQPVPLEDAPVSASPGATVCAPAELCDGGAPLTLASPITVNPDFVGKRLAAVADADSPTGTFAATFGGGGPIQCDLRIDSALTAAQLAAQLPPLGDRADYTLCLTANATWTFPADLDTNGMNIISNGPIHFPRSGNNQPTFRDSTIVTFAGSVTTANDRATIIGSKVFSEGSLDFNGAQTTISGITTLASNGNVVVNGGAPPVDTGISPSVGFAIIATGNVTINGSADWYVAASVGGTFTQNGTATVYGVIEAKNTITINGGIDIDSGLPIANEDTMTEGPPRVTVVSMR